MTALLDRRLRSQPDHRLRRVTLPVVVALTRSGTEAGAIAPATSVQANLLTP
jgi:hypothetical protein